MRQRCNVHASRSPIGSKQHDRSSTTTIVYMSDRSNSNDTYYTAYERKLLISVHKTCVLQPVMHALWSIKFKSLPTLGRAGLRRNLNSNCARSCLQLIMTSTTPGPTGTLM